MKLIDSPFFQLIGRKEDSDARMSAGDYEFRGLIEL